MTITKWIICLSLSIFSLSHAKNAEKLIGGKRIKIESYPHYASVRHRGHHVCGGSIISTLHILTTASCIVLEPEVVAGNLQVLTGSSSIFHDEPSSSIHEISYIIYHEDYSAINHWINDIAILQLESPIVYSLSRSMISLPDRKLSVKTNVQMIGWNEFLIPYNLEAKYLHIISLKVNTYAECHQISQDTRINFYYHACVSTTILNEAITLGDSGSGVLHYREIIGIVSVQLPISKNTSPVLVTRIFDHIEWIHKYIN